MFEWIKVNFNLVCTFCVKNINVINNEERNVNRATIFQVNILFVLFTRYKDPAGTANFSNYSTLIRNLMVMGKMHRKKYIIAFSPIKYSIQKQNLLSFIFIYV